jgi:hypothetical protein
MLYEDVWGGNFSIFNFTGQLDPPFRLAYNAEIITGRERESLVRILIVCNARESW